MHVDRLQLENFRCYRELDFSPHSGRTVVIGANAQGKSSLLESFVVAATTRAAHGAADRDLVRREPEGAFTEFGRVTAGVARTDEHAEIDVLLLPRQRENGFDGSDPTDSRSVSKRVRVNGAPRRAVDAVGLARAVLFAPQDLALVDGSPSVRRRYLDVLLCQLDRAYCRSLTTYGKVLAQRNHLLRQLSGRSRSSGPDELAYWDEELATSGGHVLAVRADAVGRIAREAARIHDELTGQAPKLDVDYETTVAPLPDGSGPSARSSESDFAGGDSGPDSFGGDDFREAREAEYAMAAAMRAALAARRREEIARGVTVVGPHRDDIALSIGGTDLRRFGSRGQQRSAAVALKLAEATLLDPGADPPIILLDDVLSELDADRREYLAASVVGAGQVLLTATELDQVPEQFRRGAQILSVRRAEVATLTLEGAA